MCVASTQASRFVRTDGRSKALFDSRLARRWDDSDAPVTVNNTSWLGNWVGQNYSFETRATLLGRYHSDEWGMRRAHDLEKTLLDWGRKATTPGRTGALRNRPLLHRIWRRHMYNVTLPHNTRHENFGLHMCVPVRTNFYVGRMSEVCCAYHLRRDSKAHDIGPTCRALQEAACNVVLSIIRNEVVVRAGPLYCDGLLVPGSVGQRTRAYRVD